VIALIAVFVFGADPAQMLGSLQQQTQEQQAFPPARRRRAGSSAQEICTVNPFSRESCNALSSLNKTWKPRFAKPASPSARRSWYSIRSRATGCGKARWGRSTARRPGHLHRHRFHNEMDKQMDAGGDFARDYVMAHEYGHHIQNLLGLSDQVHSLQQRNPSRANELSVRLELQADCYAGVWAGLNKDRIGAGRHRGRLKAAHQIGDDTLMKAAGRRPVEAAFTHGSGAAHGLAAQGHRNRRRGPVRPSLRPSAMRP
jgi:predicted metalloprotease